LLQVYRQKDIAGSSAFVENLAGFPPARGNFTLTLCEGDQKGKQDLYLFGGEYFDGIENIVVDHLLRWDKNENWKQIITPSATPAPTPRCAHSTVYYNGALYVFGGELATADRYHHYKDLWRYDVKKQTWSECTSRTGSVPSPRSGHAAIAWKNFMIIFGGFYEVLRDTPRWFNDVYCFDLKTQQWMDVPHSKLGSRPEPRSACNIALIGDAVLIHGGFSKLQNANVAGGKESKVHTDAWLLNLKPLLQGKPPTWDRLLSSSARGGANSRNPNGRSGTASATYKNRMLVFGGVVDSELMHHKVDSVFYNDLFAFDLDQRKWYPLRVRKGGKKDNQRRRNKRKTGTEGEGDDQEEDKDEPAEAEGGEANDEGDDDNADDDDLSEADADDPGNDGDTGGWNIDMLRSNMFAFIDGDGNIVYERIEEDDPKATTLLEGKGAADSEEEEETKEADEFKEEEGECKEEKSEEDDDECKKVEKNGKADDDNGAMPKDKEPSQSDVPAKNTKSISSSAVMIINPDTKVAEAVQREDPLPRMNAALVVKGHILYLYGGIVEIGDREVTLDDMWSLDLRKRDGWNCLFPGTMHRQVWRGAIHDDDDSYISTGAGEDDDDDDNDDDSEDSEDDNVGQIKLKKPIGLREEISELNAKYNLNDERRTPQNGEVLADFYARTSAYWNEHAIEMLRASSGNSEPPSKELKREGFGLARQRFEELEPVMERLKELGLEGDATPKAKKLKTKKKKSRK
jgi:hypothetical protein